MNRIYFSILLIFQFFVIHSQEGITVKDGRVGIGTITPTTDLELNGTLKLSDTIIGVNNPVISNGQGSLLLTNNALTLNASSDHQLGQMTFGLSSGSNGVLRLEGRPQFLFAGDSLGMQMGTIPFAEPNNIWMEVGDKGTFLRNKVGINITDPIRPLHISSFNAQMRLQSPNTFTDFNHFDAGSGQVAILDINPQPGVNNEKASIRLFRSTNTTGDATFQIFRGDNSTTSQHIFQGKGNSAVNISSGSFSIGTTSGNAKLEVLADSLGATVGSKSMLQRLWNRNANADKLDFTSERITAGSNWISAALQIQRVVDQTEMGYMRFGHSVNGPISMGVGTTELARISGAGYLGLNASSPARRLHVVEPTAAVVARFESSNTLGAKLRLHKTGLDESIGAEITADVNHAAFGWSGDGVGDYTSIIVGDEKMRFTESGDIGVGTTTPQSKMHIRNANDGGDIYSGLRVNPAKAPAEVTRNSHNYHRISGFRREGLWLGGSSDGNVYTKSNILFKDEGIIVGMSDGVIDPEQNPKLYISNGGNIGVGTTNVSSSGTNILTLAKGEAPSSSLSNSVQLFASTVLASTTELRVRDEAGNVTTLSPHNFSLIEKPSHELAWSYYSEKDGMAINVDMFRVVQLLEELTGEKLIHIEKIDQTGSDQNGPNQSKH